MQLDLTIQNASKYPLAISATTLEQWILRTLKQVSPKTEEQAEFTLRLVDKKEMTQLNGQFRTQYQPTNVLSFPGQQHHPSGDIVICAPILIEEANTQHKSVNDHCAHLVIHAVLHCLGFDHIDPQEASVMEAHEIAILKDFAIANPYEETLYHGN